MDRDELRARTKQFAHRCVKLALALPESTTGQTYSVADRFAARPESRQTTGPHVLLSHEQHSVSKLSIVVEEVDESCFWMEFYRERRLLPKRRIAPIARLKARN